MARRQSEDRGNMHSPFVGEFAGTLVLILLGDGVVANVLLKRSKAEGAGWMVITTAWGFAVLCGIFTAIAFGSADAHLNPAVTLAFAITSGNYAKIVPYWSAQVSRRVLRRDAGVAVFPAALEADGGPRCKAALSSAPRPRFVIIPANSVLRSDRHDAADRGGGRYRFEDRGSYRTDDWTGSVLRFDAGVGDWIVAGRDDRVRHQSRARLRPARSARGMAGRRKGKFRLGVRADSDSGAAVGRCAGRDDPEGRAHRLIGEKIPRGAPPDCERSQRRRPMRMRAR